MVDLFADSPIGWEDNVLSFNSTCCLVCLGAVYGDEVDGCDGGKCMKKPLDIFLNFCELLNVSFSDIRQDWNFGESSERLPFCESCCETVLSTIGLQEQIEFLQKKIVDTVEAIRNKIRQTYGGYYICSSVGNFQRVHNFRSIALGINNSAQSECLVRFSNSPSLRQSPVVPSVTGSSCSSPSWCNSPLLNHGPFLTAVSSSPLPIIEQQSNVLLPLPSPSPPSVVVQSPTTFSPTAFSFTLETQAQAELELANTGACTLIEEPQNAPFPTDQNYFYTHVDFYDREVIIEGYPSPNDEPLTEIETCCSARASVTAASPLVDLPASSLVNPPAGSPLNPPASSLVHAPASTVVHPPAIPVVHPPAIPVVHPPAIPVVHPPAIPVVHPPAIPVVHPPTNPLVNPPADSLLIPPASSIVHRPASPLVNRSASPLVNTPCCLLVNHPANSLVSHLAWTLLNPPASSLVHPPASPLVNPPVSLPANPPASFPTNSPASLPTNPPASLPTNSPASLPTNPPASSLVHPPASPLVNPPASFPTNSPASLPTNSPASPPLRPPPTPPPFPPPPKPRRKYTPRRSRKPKIEEYKSLDATSPPASPPPSPPSPKAPKPKPRRKPKSEKPKKSTASTKKTVAVDCPQEPTKQTSKLSRKQAASASSPPKRKRRPYRQNEQFAPVETTAEGIMTFENIIITAIKSGGYLCGKCNATCGKTHDAKALRKMKVHIKGHHLGAYKCQVCDKNFTSHDILIQHISRTHETREKPCDDCGKPIRPRYMLLHKYTHMNAEEKAALVATGFKPQTSYFEREKRFPCSKCGAMFKKRTNLHIHEQTHMDEKTRPRVKCERCDKSYTNAQSLKEHMDKVHIVEATVRADVRRKEACKICGKVIFEHKMDRHMTIHLAPEDRPLACGVCGKRYQDSAALTHHEQKFHEKDDTPEKFPFACYICGQRYTTRMQMRCHVEGVHKYDLKTKKLLKVKTCDATTENASDSYANSDKLQHLKENLYSYRLYPVEMISVSESGGKADETKQVVGYKCKSCSLEHYAEVKDKAEEMIKLHVKEKHIGNFQCNLCTKRMKNLGEMILHKRNEHMYLNNYDCPVCLRPGIPRRSVRTHELSHMSVYEVAELINRGDSLPIKAAGEKKWEQMEVILKEMQEAICFECVICSEKMYKLVDLDNHVIKTHDCHPKRNSDALQTSERKRKYSKGQNRKQLNNNKKIKISPDVVSRMDSNREVRIRLSDGGNTKRRNNIKAKMDTDDEDTTSEADDDSEDEEEEEVVELGSDESDPEFIAKVKVSMCGGEESGRRLSLRARRPKRNVNYDEEKEGDAQESTEEIGIIPKSKCNDMNSNSSQENIVKTEEVEQEENEQGGEKEVFVYLVADTDIKESPYVSEEEDWKSEDMEN